MGKAKEVHNKEFLVNAIVATEGVALTKVGAERVLNQIVGTIQDEVAKGNVVKLMGFGQFESRDRAARKGRNPQTGEELMIPATTIPAFKPGKLFKDAVK